jgi:hypothetical protein
MSSAIPVFSREWLLSTLPSVPSSINHLWFAVFACFALCLIRLIVTPIAKPFARILGNLVNKNKMWHEENEEKVQKFGEQTFKLLSHVSFVVYGYFAFSPSYNSSNTCWFGSTSQCYDALRTSNALAHTNVAVFYMVELGYHLHSFLFQFIEGARGDYKQMLIHHVATIILVSLSYLSNFCMWGILVFLIHEFSDIFTSITKMLHYVRFDSLSAVSFVLLVSSWIFTRLYMLTFDIFVPGYTSFRPIEGSTWSDSSNISWIIQMTTLFTLICLHTYWFWLFVKMGYGIVFKKRFHDYNEEKEGPKDHDEKQQQQQQQEEKKERDSSNNPIPSSAKETKKTK